MDKGQDKMGEGAPAPRGGIARKWTSRTAIADKLICSEGKLW